MTDTIRCKNESDRILIEVILNGNNYSTKEHGPDGLAFTDRSNLLGEKIRDLPQLRVDEDEDDRFYVYVCFTHLDVTQIEEYLEEVERLRNILEEIAIQVGESYVTRSRR